MINDGSFMNKFSVVNGSAKKGNNNVNSSGNRGMDEDSESNMTNNNTYINTYSNTPTKNQGVSSRRVSFGGTGGQVNRTPLVGFSPLPPTPVNTKYSYTPYSPFSPFVSNNNTSNNGGGSSSSSSPYTQRQGGNRYTENDYEDINEDTLKLLWSDVQKHILTDKRIISVVMIYHGASRKCLKTLGVLTPAAQTGQTPTDQIPTGLLAGRSGRVPLAEQERNPRFAPGFNSNSLKTPVYSVTGILRTPGGGGSSSSSSGNNQYNENNKKERSWLFFIFYTVLCQGVYGLLKGIFLVSKTVFKWLIK